MRERLKKICEDINKSEWGGEHNDAISLLGECETKNIERFHSGSLVLDWVLGGGWPRGRIVEIYGAESGGKCVEADTFLYGRRGLETVHEVFSGEGYLASCTSRVVEHSYPLVSEDGFLEDTTHFWWNNKRKVVRIETSRGLKLGGTYRHPIRVMDDRGFVGWKYCSDVVCGDRVVVQGGMMLDPPENGCDEDDAVLLGLVIAEGYIGHRGRIGFSNTNAGLLTEFRRLMKLKFGFDNVLEYHQPDRTTIELHCNSVDLFDEFCGRYGVAQSLADGKVVPRCVRTAPLFVQTAFLRTIYGCEGSVDSSGDRRRIEISSKSRELLCQVQLMALNLGAFGALCPKPVDDEIYWRLTFDGADASAWQAMVYPSTFFPNKVVPEISHETTHSNMQSSAWMAAVLLSDCANSDRSLCCLLGDCAAGKCELTSQKFQKLIAVSENYLFGPAASAILLYMRRFYGAGWRTDVVKKVEKPTDPVPTFDFTKPDHTFWSNGLISHNTTLCYHAMAEFQKKYSDEPIAFVDTEFAFDENYAKLLGLDPEPVLHVQPESGEQALNNVKQLVREGCGLVVCDSVAALVPREEDDEISLGSGGGSMGAQARLMSKAMRQLTRDAGRRNSTLIFTNQIREKIGVMFGDKTTTPGGRALGFYSSIRLEIKRIGSEKDNDGDQSKVIGIKCQVRGMKNKVAPPFRKGEVILKFGSGLDRPTELFIEALNLKFVRKAGSWFKKHDGTSLGQGRLNAIESMKEDPKFMAEIEQMFLKKFDGQSKPVKMSSGKKKKKTNSGLGEAKHPVKKKPEKDEKSCDVEVSDV